MMHQPQSHNLISSKSVPDKADFPVEVKSRRKMMENSLRSKRIPVVL
jgi:hypothetical protein